MSGRATRVSWIPALVVGAAAAGTAQMAAGLLLYARDGFVTALTVILCVQAGALGFGLWLAPQDVAPPWTGVRRAWLLLMVTYVGGAVVAGSWELLGGLASTWTSRGLGLALLTALPLYASGLLLGAPALAHRDLRPGPIGALGAALGFGLVGFFGAGLELVASAYVASMTAASAAALLHGGVLEARERALREGETDPPADPGPP